MMSRCVPRTLEALLLHALPPPAAELFTQKLEQADAAAAETGATLCIWLHAMDSYVQMCFMPRTDIVSAGQDRWSRSTPGQDQPYLTV